MHSLSSTITFGAMPWVHAAQSSTRPVLADARTCKLLYMNSHGERHHRIPCAPPGTTGTRSPLIEVAPWPLRASSHDPSRDETAAEKALKEEVALLTTQLEELKAVDPEGDVVKEAAEKLDAKERELLKLQAEEDDKVRYARGRTESRDGPGAGAKQQQGGSREPPARKERW